MAIFSAVPGLPTGHSFLYQFLRGSSGTLIQVPNFDIPFVDYSQALSKCDFDHGSDCLCDDDRTLWSRHGSKQFDWRWLRKIQVLTVPLTGDGLAQIIAGFLGLVTSYGENIAAGPCYLLSLRYCGRAVTVIAGLGWALLVSRRRFKILFQICIRDYLPSLGAEAAHEMNRLAVPSCHGRRATINT